MTEKMIRDAYVRIRTIDQTIPDDVLDFMKDASIEKLKQVNNNIVLADVSGRSELLVSFLKWYVKDEMMRKEKELITSIVERYLNETNSH